MVASDRAASLRSLLPFLMFVFGMVWSCDRSSSPAITGKDGNETFWKACRALDPALIGNIHSRDLEKAYEPPDPKLAALLEQAQPTVEALLVSTADPGLRPLYAGVAELPLDAPDTARTIVTAAAVLGADLRKLLAEGETEAAAKRAEAILHLARALTDENRTLASLTAASILDKRLPDVRAIFMDERTSVAAQSRLRAAVETFDPVDPLNLASALHGDAESILAAIREKSLADATAKRDAGLYRRPEDGQPPDDAELRRFVDAFIARDVQPPFDEFLAHANAAWAAPDARPQLEQLVARAERGEFGPLAVPLAESLLTTYACHIDMQARILALRKLVGAQD